MSLRAPYASVFSTLDENIPTLFQGWSRDFTLVSINSHCTDRKYEASSYSKVQATEKKREIVLQVVFNYIMPNVKETHKAICPVSQLPRVCRNEQSHGGAVVNSIHLVNQCTVKFFRQLWAWFWVPWKRLVEISSLLKPHRETSPRFIFGKI